MRRYPILLVSLLASFAGCAGMIVTPVELEVGKVDSILRQNYGNPELIIVDVRSAKEYDSGHLEHALNIPVESASFRPGVDRLDRTLSYLLYCRSGNRATEARDTMLAMGFKNVTVISGGILAWQRAGYRTVRDEE